MPGMFYGSRPAGSGSGMFGVELDPQDVRARIAAAFEAAGATPQETLEFFRGRGGGRLDPMRVPPRSEPLPFGETMAGTTGEGLYGVPVAGPSLLGGAQRLESYATGAPLEDIQTRQEQFRRLHPEISRSAQAAGSMAPMPFLGAGGLGAQVVGNAALAGADAMVRNDDPLLPAAVGGGLAIFGGPMANMPTVKREALDLAKRLQRLGVRPPKENLYEVGDATFRLNSPIGDATADISNLMGGTNLSDPKQRARVDRLKDDIVGPDGYIERLIVDQDGNVIEGQHRLDALRELGVQQVPVSVIRDLERGVTLSKIEDAVRAAGETRGEQARQVARNTLEMAQDVGVENVARNYEFPRGFERSHQAALDALRGAPAMKNAASVKARLAQPGASVDKTGWRQGKDEKWRFEIDDSKSLFNPDPARNARPGDVPLSDVLKHDALYEAYPELRGVRVMIGTPGIGYKGSFSGGIDDGFIRLQLTSNPADMHKTLLHEIQHWVQLKEGFATGANTFGLKPNTPAWEIYKSIKKKMAAPLSYDEYIQQAGGGTAWPTAQKDYVAYRKKAKEGNKLYDKIAQQTAVELAYKRSAGEAEARNVSRRFPMSPEERARVAPESTEDIPRAEQIVQFRGPGDQVQEARDLKHFSPYSKVGQDIPVTETAPIYAPGSGPRLINKAFDPMTLKPGDRIVGFVGDRSHTGEDVAGIDIGGQQTMFKNPVPSEGGAGYMSHEYNPQSAVWASNQGPTTAQEKRLRAHLEEAKGDVYGATLAMAAPGIDFSVQAAKAALETVRAQPLTRNARNALYDAIDEAMAAPIGNGKDFPAIPDWPGVRKFLKDGRHLEDIPGKWRAKLLKRLDSDPLKRLGAGNMAAVRYGVTAPEQRNASVLEAGHGWFKMGDEARRLSPEEVIRGHTTYPWVTASPGGEYAGTRAMPVELVFPGLARRVRGMNASGQQRTASMQDVYEVVTPRQLERFQRWLQSEKGKQLGVAGAVAAGLLTAAQADALFGGSQTDRPSA